MSVLIEVLFTNGNNPSVHQQRNVRSEYTLHFCNTLWVFKVLFPVLFHSLSKKIRETDIASPASLIVKGTHNSDVMVSLTTPQWMKGKLV